MSLWQKIANWWGISLQRKLLVTILAIVISFLLILVISVFVYGLVIVQDKIENQNELVLESESIYLNQALENTFNNLFVIIDILRENPDDILLQQQAIYNLNKQQFMVFKELYLLNTDGQILVHLGGFKFLYYHYSNIFEENILLSHDEDSQLFAVYQETAKGSDYISEVLYNTDYGFPTIMMGFPVNDDQNETNRLLVAEVDLRYVWEYLNRIDAGENSRSYLVSNKGEILTHPETNYIGTMAPPEALIGNQESFKYVDPISGDTMIALSKQVGQNLDWVLVTEQNYEAAIDPILGFFWTTFFSSIGVILLLSWFVSLLSRRIIDPLNNLALTSENITSSGDLTQKLEVNTKDEIHKLANSLNAMLQTIQEKEKQLNESKQRYKSIFLNSPVSLWLEDYSEVKQYLDGLKSQGIEDIRNWFEDHPEEIKLCLQKIRIIDVNPYTLKMMECDHKSQLTGSLLEYSPKHIWSNFIDEFELLSNGITHFETEKKYITIKNNTGFAQINFAISQGSEDTWDKVLVSMVDITHLRQVENELQGSEERFRSVVESAPDAIISANSRGEIIGWNKSAENIFGFTADEALGSDVSKIVMDEYKTAHVAAFKNISITGKLRLESKPITMQAKNKDGLNFPVEIMLSSWKSGGETYVTAIVRDISLRKKTEEALLEAQKLAELGTMAAGIAHEINTPLQIITGLSATLRKQIQKDGIEKDRMTDKLGNINENAWRIAHIVRSLLTYARVNENEFHEYDLNSIIRDTITLIQHQIKHWSNTNIKLNLSNDLPLLFCERNSLMQVLINLITNANDSMPIGGDIEIHTTYHKDADRIELSVKDSGTGIDDEIKQKIFTPFFTTKPIGKGTGLGLSIVMSIIKTHDGHIDVQSTPGDGTTVSILLPRKFSSAHQIGTDTQNLGRFNQ